MYILLNFLLIFSWITMCENFNNIDAIQNETEESSNDIDQLTTKYIKHLAGGVTVDYLHNETRYIDKIVGVIINYGLILTNIAWDKTTRERTFRRATIHSKNLTTNIFAGQLEFNETLTGTNIARCISLHNWRKRLKMRSKKIPSLQNIANNANGNQLTVIIPKRSLLKNGTIEAIKLATETPRPDVICTIITYGRLGDAPTYNATAITVQIMPKIYCDKFLCEYNDPICVRGVSSPNLILSKYVNGGEPLICNDELWGIVRGGDVNSEALPAASIYENREWLNTQLKKIRISIEQSRCKSSGNQLSYFICSCYYGKYILIIYLIYFRYFNEL